MIQNPALIIILEIFATCFSVIAAVTAANQMTATTSSVIS